MIPAAVLALLVCGAEAAVRIRVAPGPLEPATVASTRRIASSLLQSPTQSAAGGELLFEAPGWSSKLDAPGRERALAALKQAWGDRVSVQEDAAAAPRAADSRLASAAPRADLSRAREALGRTPELSGKSSQDRFYDGGTRGDETPAAAAFPASRESLPRVAAAPKARAAVPAPWAPRAEVSVARMGKEALKGAFGVVKDAISWKGLAIAAGSVALVTLAPVTVYAILGVGAVMAGWTIGKAIANGYQARKRGDAEGVYAASREFGRGAFTLGLTMLGARHPPASLKPHFPSTSGEWQAIASAVDDEPIIVMSLLRKGD